MISEGATGSGFRGLTDYLRFGSKGSPNPARVAWTDTRNLLSGDPALAPSIMRATAKASKRVKKPVYHMSISWPPEERPDQETIAYVVDEVLKDLGLEAHQALLIAHRHTEHTHVHVVINRVHPETGRAWCNSWDRRHREKSLRRLEQELGFRYVPGRHSDPEKSESMGRRAKRGDRQQAAKKDTKALNQFPPERIKALKADLAPAFESAKSWVELEATVSARGLRFEKKGQGLVLTDGTAVAKLSQVTAKEHRLRKLEERFGEPFKEREKETDEECDIMALLEEADQADARERHNLQDRDPEQDLER